MVFVKSNAPFDLVLCHGINLSDKFLSRFVPDLCPSSCAETLQRTQVLDTKIDHIPRGDALGLFMVRTRNVHRQSMPPLVPCDNV